MVDLSSPNCLSKERALQEYNVSAPAAEAQALKYKELCTFVGKNIKQTAIAAFYNRSVLKGFVISP